MDMLTGRHALITGGGTGVGAAIARRLAVDGAAVTLVGRRREPIDGLARELGKAVAIVADITRAVDCARMVGEARAAHGPLDIVVANAGAAESAAFAKTDAALWSRMLDVNLSGAYLTAHAVWSDLTRTGDDGSPLRRLIFVASTAGLKGYPYVAAYVAAKHGVVGLARALAVECAKTPLTVNAVCPGFTETPLLDASVAGIVAKTGRSAADARAALAKSNPQGRLIQPAEVAATVAWLCSPDSGSVTGQALSISGGEV